MRCAKCNVDEEEYWLRTAEAKNFVFCKFCNSFLDDHPHLSVRDYLGPKWETVISNNIRMAAKARKQRKSPWAEGK